MTSVYSPVDGQPRDGQGTQPAKGVQHDVPTAPLEAASSLIKGSTASLTSADGRIEPLGVVGIFNRDVRLISLLNLKVDGKQPALLSTNRHGSSGEQLTYVGALDKYSNGRTVITRWRYLQEGVATERLEVLSFQERSRMTVSVELQSDGVSVIDLKSAVAPTPPLSWSSEGEVARAGDVCEVRTTGADHLLADDTLTLSWNAEAAPGSPWSAEWSVVPAISLDDVEAFSLPRLRVSSFDHRWAPSLRAAIDDVEALVMTHEGEGGRRHKVIGAGSPWYLALFGRDSILTSWESLVLGTDLALETLEVLATYQGKSNDERLLEAPGKILHERRLGPAQVFGIPQGSSYFGAVDASPLFVCLLAESHRWGADRIRIADLLPAARAAIQWCASISSREFLWFGSDIAGLRNQSWKDSGDCMVHENGTLAEGPLAVAEVQGYWYDALIGMAMLEAELGNPEAEAPLLAVAARLREAFTEKFWRPKRGLLAMALDGSGKPLEVASSNMGHVLWSGILDPGIAAQVADRVMQPDLLTSWGVRTLGSNERVYNPLGYHLGSIWAHDSAVIAAGMARHGFTQYARTITERVLSAAEAFGWRLPELFGGIDGPDGAAPVPYPASCSPQAWSAGAPLLLLRAVAGLEPDLANRTLRVSSALRDDEYLQVDGIQFAGRAHRLVLSGSRGSLSPMNASE